MRYALILGLGSDTNPHPSSPNHCANTVAVLATAVGVDYTTDGGYALIVDGDVNDLATFIDRVDALSPVTTETAPHPVHVEVVRISPLPTNTADPNHIGCAATITSMLTNRRLLERWPNFAHLHGRMGPRLTRVSA